MNTYYIYKATNKINGKSYIGKTNNIGSRVRQHLTCKQKDSIFHEAIIDYGINSFVWEFIECVKSNEVAADLERKYIKEFNTLIPNGYNESRGEGGVSSSKPIVALTIDGKFLKRYEYLREVLVDGYDVSSVRRSLSSDYRLAKGHMFMHEDDYLKNGPKKYNKPKSTSRKKIVQCDLNGNFISKFDSVVEAADITGSTRTTISANLTGRYKNANGFIFVYEKNFPIKDISIYKKKGKGIKVAQIDPKTNETLNVFDSIKQAGDSLGVSYKNIQKILRIPNRTAYGYKWKEVK